MSGEKDEKRESVDWGQLSVDAMNRHTTSPEFTARYKKGLEEDERRGTLTEVRKKDLEAVQGVGFSICTRRIDACLSANSALVAPAVDARPEGEPDDCIAGTRYR